MTKPLDTTSLTPSCHRIFQRFLAFAAREQDAKIGHLVLAILAEESLGGSCLQKLGLDISRISAGCFGDQIAALALSLTAGQMQSESTAENTLPCDSSVQETISSIMQIGWATSIYERATFLARRSAAPTATSSEHLVLAMVDTTGEVYSELVRLGIHADEVRMELIPAEPLTTAMAVDFELVLDVEPNSPHENTNSPHTPLSRQLLLPSAEYASRVHALLDANLNRSREGFRVLEDFARFVLRSPESSEALKRLRHDLVSAEHILRSVLPELLSARDTNADVGTAITTEAELRRDSLNDVVAANARRVQESLRSLEEFGKTISTEFATRIKQLRYRTYTLEQNLILNHSAIDSICTEERGVLRESRLAKLAKSRLYVLMTESSCSLPWKHVTDQVLSGGADVIQLREKSLSDRDLVIRGRWLADACKAAGALFIMNDRSDLAVVTNADGVHVGQQDDAVATARQQIGEAALVGVSSHSLVQFAQACTEGADYLGVGPVFVSQTKDFDRFPGLQYVAGAAEVADRPWFAIGGINSQNLSDVLSAGACRVAVCGSVLGSSNPEQVVQAIRQQVSADS